MPLESKTTRIKTRDAAVRRRAVAQLHDRKKAEAPTLSTKVETERLVHELQLRQIELEMQNEELVRTRNEREALLAQYADLYDFAPVGYFTLAPDGAIRRVNLSGSNLLGMERSKLLNRRFRLSVSAESRATFNSFLERVIKTGAKVNCQVTLSKKNNEPIRAHLEATCSDDGAELRIVVMDITERTRAEEALRASEKNYRTLMEQAPDGIFISDEAGRLIDVNTAACYLLGYTRGELLQMLASELIAPEDHAARPVLLQELHTEKTIYMERILVRKDGTRLQVENHGRTLDDGRLQGIVRDITERKRIEQQLHESRDRLADLSRELVQIHESERRVIGRELHDQIGQILTALDLTLEIAAQLPREQAQKKYTQAQELIADLHNRVSNLTLDLRPPMLDDLGLLPTLLWHVNRFQDQSSVRVEFKHSGIEGKRFRTEIETAAYRIIQEALTNVVRHAQASLVNLTVHAADGEMVIELRDNGRGFHSSDRVEGKSTGGLRGMRERAELLGGAFEVASRPGKRTRLVTHLPL